jgi:hypothetical protein
MRKFIFPLFLIIVFFGTTYAIFLKKENQVKLYVKETNRLNRNKFSDAKQDCFESFYIEHPDHANIIESVYNTTNFERIKYTIDTVVKYLLFKSTFEIEKFDYEYFNCLIHASSIQHQNLGIKEDLHNQIAHLSKTHHSLAIDWFNHIGEEKFFLTVTLA